MNRSVFTRDGLTAKVLRDAAHWRLVLFEDNHPVRVFKGDHGDPDRELAALAQEWCDLGIGPLDGERGEDGLPVSGVAL